MSGLTSLLERYYGGAIGDTVTPVGSSSDEPPAPPRPGTDDYIDYARDTVNRGRAGSRVNNRDELDDIGLLDAFSIDEQRDALYGRGVETTLRGLANRVGAEDRARAARLRAASGADVDSGSFARGTANLDLSERQKESAARRLGLSRAIAVADAGTKSRRRTTDLAIGARRGLQELEEGAFGQELGGLTMLANAEGQRKQREAAEEAAEDSARLGLFGSVFGALLGAG